MANEFFKDNLPKKKHYKLFDEYFEKNPLDFLEFIIKNDVTDFCPIDLTHKYFTALPGRFGFSDETSSDRAYFFRHLKSYHNDKLHQFNLFEKNKDNIKKILLDKSNISKLVKINPQFKNVLNAGNQKEIEPIEKFEKFEIDDSYIDNSNPQVFHQSKSDVASEIINFFQKFFSNFLSQNKKTESAESYQNKL